MSNRKRKNSKGGKKPRETESESDDENKSTNKAPVTSKKKTKDKNEDTCYMCGDEESTLLCCEKCPRVIHLFCVRPPLFSVPLGDFYCPECKAEQENPSKYIEKKLVHSDKGKIKSMVSKLMKIPSASEFNQPVGSDVAEDYHKVIKSPMDFGTIMDKAEKQSYDYLHEFVADVHQIFANCIQYNGEKNFYTKEAQTVSDNFEKLMRREFGDHSTNFTKRNKRKRDDDSTDEPAAKKPKREASPEPKDTITATAATTHTNSEPTTATAATTESTVTTETTATTTTTTTTETAITTATATATTGKRKKSSKSKRKKSKPKSKPVVKSDSESIEVKEEKAEPEDGEKADEDTQVLMKIIGAELDHLRTQEKEQTKLLDKVHNAVQVQQTNQHEQQQQQIQKQQQSVVTRITKIPTSFPWHHTLKLGTKQSQQQSQQQQQSTETNSVGKSHNSEQLLPSQTTTTTTTITTATTTTTTTATTETTTTAMTTATTTANTASRSLYHFLANSATSSNTLSRAVRVKFNTFRVKARVDTLQDLTTKVREIFGLEPGEYKIQYTDMDNELVDILNEECFGIFLSEQGKTNFSTHLDVVLLQKRQQEQDQQQPQQQQPQQEQQQKQPQQSNNNKVSQ